MTPSTIVESGYRYAVVIDEDGDIIERAHRGWPLDMDDGDAMQEAHNMAIRCKRREQAMIDRNRELSMQSANL